MPNLLEWIGEFFDGGSFGYIEIGGDPDESQPLSFVLFTFFMSVVGLALINFAVFAYLVPPTTKNVAVATGIHVLYFVFAYWIRPVPDESNLGFSGTLFDDPFRASDDVNRRLMFAQILLGPGRFISEAFVFFTARLLGRKRIRRSPQQSVHSDTVRRLAAERAARRRFNRKAQDIAVCSLLVIACAVCALLSFTVWRTGSETQTWRSVEGRIVKRNSSGRGQNWEMQFEYAVDGKTYRAIDRHNYDPNEHVTVFVNPQDPSQAALRKGIDWPFFVMWAAFSTLAALGLIVKFALARWPQLASDEYQYERGADG